MVRAGSLLTSQRLGSRSTGSGGRGVSEGLRGGEPSPGQQSSWDGRGAGGPQATETLTRRDDTRTEWLAPANAAALGGLETLALPHGTWGSDPHAWPSVFPRDRRVQHPIRSGGGDCGLDHLPHP